MSEKKAEKRSSLSVQPTIQTPDTAEAPLPLFEDTEQFAPYYEPETFSDEEIRFLAPFFTNHDRPVYVMHNLPPQVAGALASRYSRASKGLRRIFLDEYIKPIAYPNQQKNWSELSPDNQEKAWDLSGKFHAWMETFEEHGGMADVVNDERAREFFSRWLSGFGDDSIAEQGSLHVCMESISNLAVNAIETKRLGSYLEKSSRYVDFGSRNEDGTYRYVVPGEIRGTPLESEYRRVIDRLYDLYNGLRQQYREYIEQKYPRDDNETDADFARARAAKAFDDLRELLTFATQTNVAINANGRYFESMINDLISSPIGEVRWIARQAYEELDKIVPAFVDRPASMKYGKHIQMYKRRVYQAVRDITERVADTAADAEVVKGKWVKLLKYSEDGPSEVLAAVLIRGADNITFEQLHNAVLDLPAHERDAYLKEILDARLTGDEDMDHRRARRHRLPPRGFEASEYTFSITGRAGDFRDLLRHRMLLTDRSLFTTSYGYDVDQDVSSSKFYPQIQEVLDEAAALHDRIAEEISPEIAQYAVPFGYLQNWHMTASARQIYYMAELRTGPQGRPHYREIIQQVAQAVIDVHPSLFSAMAVDRDSYGLSRRGAATAEAKKKSAFMARSGRK